MTDTPPPAPLSRSSSLEVPPTIGFDELKAISERYSAPESYPHGDNHDRRIARQLARQLLAELDAHAETKRRLVEVEAKWRHWK